MKSLLRNKAFIFTITLLVIFFTLTRFHLFWYGLAAPGGDFYSGFVKNYLNYPEWLTQFLMQSSAAVLELFGNETMLSGHRLRIIGGSSVGVGYSCLGFGVISFLIAFLIAYPAKRKSKLLFFPLVLISIMILNILRIAGIVYAYSNYPKLYSMDIDHHAIFNAVVYILTFMMIYFWTNAQNNTVLSGSRRK